MQLLRISAQFSGLPLIHRSVLGHYISPALFTFYPAQVHPSGLAHWPPRQAEQQSSCQPPIMTRIIISNLINAPAQAWLLGRSRQLGFPARPGEDSSRRQSGDSWEMLNPQQDIPLRDYGQPQSLFPNRPQAIKQPAATDAEVEAGPSSEPAHVLHTWRGIVARRWRAVQPPRPRRHRFYFSVSTWWVIWTMFFCLLLFAILQYFSKFYRDDAMQQSTHPSWIHDMENLHGRGLVSGRSASKPWPLNWCGWKWEACA